MRRPPVRANITRCSSNVEVKLGQGWSPSPRSCRRERAVCGSRNSMHGKVSFCGSGCWSRRLTEWLV